MQRVWSRSIYPIDFEKSSSVYIKDPTGYDIELSKVSRGGL